MKKYLFILILCMPLISKSQPSVYHPFPDSNAVWNFNSSNVCWFPGPPHALSFDYSIIISGDTLINGTNYHRLINPYWPSYTSLCVVGGSIINRYRGAIRQDTTARKVYLVAADSTSEELLYDFTMQQGDTVKGYLEHFAPLPDTVISVDSVMVGNSYRKRWFINYYYDIYIIEGVGSTYGLLEQSPGNATDLDNLTLLCFNQDGQTLYPDMTTNCVLQTGVHNINQDEMKIIIFPNPVTSVIYFKKKQMKNETSKIEIFNTIGDKVYERDQINLEDPINVEKLPGGIYFIKVTEEATVKIEKFIKL